MKRFLIIAMAIMVLFTLTPDVAEAANKSAKSKKTVTVSVKGGETSGGRILVVKGQKNQIVVKYGGKNVTKKAKYKTSRKTVATVSKKGLITAKKTGNCSIKVTYKGKKKTIKLKVVNPWVSGTKKPATGGNSTGNTSGTTGGNSDGNNGGNSTGNGNTGGTTGGNSNGNTETGNGTTTHQHDWKPYTVTTKTWVPDIRKIKVTIAICQTCGKRIAGSTESSQSVDAINKHGLEHLLKGESSGTYYEESEQEMDCGYYVEAGQTYYKCDCGAVKK